MNLRLKYDVLIFWPALAVIMRIYKNLSPLTHKEVLNELCELKNRGINVVYSTHSPYLIPNEWESVHFVTMTNSGTTLTQENKYDLLKQVTGGDIFDLQEVLDQYQRSDKESL